MKHPITTINQYKNHKHPIKQKQQQSVICMQYKCSESMNVGSRFHTGIKGEKSVVVTPVTLLPTVATGLFTLIICVYLTGFSIFHLLNAGYQP